MPPAPEAAPVAPEELDEPDAAFADDSSEPAAEPAAFDALAVEAPPEDPAVAAAYLASLAGAPPPPDVPAAPPTAPPPRPPRLRAEDVAAALACFALAAVAAWPLATRVRRVIENARYMDGPEWRGESVAIGVLGLVVALMIYWGVKSLTWRRKRWRTSRRVQRRLCGHCGYDLRGAARQCPECGWVIPESYESMAAKLDAIGPPMFVPTATYGGYGAYPGYGPPPAQVMPPRAVVGLPPVPGAPSVEPDIDLDDPAPPAKP
ncbi:MAG TPA: hypothetical protein VEA69_26155 [Tepidisphaeraceae bacterium]|nr:hypothetical protein [Tepidisphaeraceae bacterium]